MTAPTSSTARSTDPAIQLDRLAFRYSSDGPQVLDIPTLEIKRGERVFVHGPSGSGKTTLLGLLAGVLSGATGSIRILGQELVGMSASRRDAVRGSHVGYIFQMFNLIPYLSVEQNIRLSAELNSVRASRVPDGDLVRESRRLAEALGLDSKLDANVTQLSVGQQQRVAAARALLGSPEIVIADEPTSALDQDHREKFLQLLFDECKRSGATLVFVSHDRTLERLFDRTIALREVNRA